MAPKKKLIKPKPKLKKSGGKGGKGGKVSKTSKGSKGSKGQKRSKGQKKVKGSKKEGRFAKKKQDKKGKKKDSKKQKGKAKKDKNGKDPRDKNDEGSDVDEDSSGPSQGKLGLKGRLGGAWKNMKDDIRDDVMDRMSDKNSTASASCSEVALSGRSSTNVLSDDVTDRNDDVTIREINEKTTCAVCGCGDEVRIVLRICGHITCLPCALDYLKRKIVIDVAAEISCPSSDCDKLIHENDIAALLDDKEPALELYMPIEHRRNLRHRHAKHGVYYALCTPNVRHCPLCKSVYTHEDGCNYVRCANSACRTQFCWTCGKLVGRPVTHYTTASNCSLGYLDLVRIFFFIRLIVDINTIGLLIGLPFVICFCYMYLPVIVFFAVPISLMIQTYQSATEKTDLLTPAERALLAVKMLSSLAIGFVVALPIAIGSLASSFVLVGLYLMLIGVKLSSYGGKLQNYYRFMCILRWAGRLFRIGPYGKLLQEARKENDLVRDVQQGTFDPSSTKSSHPSPHSIV